MKNYELRLQLIQAKCQLILNQSGGRPWHDEITKDLYIIMQEAQKAYEEVAKDGRWAAGDR